MGVIQNLHCFSSFSNGLFIYYIEDLRGDIIIKGLFEQNQDCIIDVCVTDTDVPSYRTRNPIVLLNHRRQKRRRNICDPVSSNGGLLCFLLCLLMAL